MLLADVISGSPNDIPVVVGAIVTLVGGFFAISKIMLNQASKDREADRQERLHLASAINAMAKGSENMAVNIGKVAVATEKQASEAKARNGHLAELSSKSLSVATETLERLEKSAVIAAEDRDSLVKQHVETQLVDKQVIKGD
jgi:hypothetical protein